MQWKLSKGVNKKEKAKLRKYWRLVYPEDYVKDLVGSVNGK
jgi:hypothetical protein